MEKPPRIRPAALIRQARHRITSCGVPFPRLRGLWRRHLLDDVELFVDAARRAGIQAILFRNNKQAIAEAEALLNS